MAGWGDAAGNVTNWVSKFFKRKDANLEKDASKAAMSGDVNSMRNLTDKLYKGKRKRRG